MKQIVLLLHEFQVKLNQGFIGADFWNGVDQLAQMFGPGVHKRVSDRLKCVLAGYNREMESHRKYLTDLRNNIAAHRDLDLQQYYSFHLQLDIERIRQITLKTFEFYMAFLSATDEVLTQGLARLGSQTKPHQS